MKTSTFQQSEHTFKKIVLLLVVFLYVISGYSQENKYVFTGIYNYQEGENRSPMIGLVNETRNIFKSFQLGLVNQAHDGVSGVQIGLVNNNKAGLNGSSIGLVNQLGNLNSGTAIGLVNHVKSDLNGVSIGLVNNSIESSEGFQLGLVNHTRSHSKGLRVGLVNQSKHHEGLMIGLVNKADSLDGKAIGFINMLKQDVFLSISANYHFDQWAEVQFKSGIKELYGIISYQKGFYQLWESHAIGYGLGSRIQLSQKLLISPEIIYHSQISPYWNTKGKSNPKFSGYLNLVIPISRNVEIVFAKNLHFAKNNPFFHENSGSKPWNDKPNQLWISGHIGTTIRLQKEKSNSKK